MRPAIGLAVFVSLGACRGGPPSESDRDMRLADVRQSANWSPDSALLSCATFLEKYPTDPAVAEVKGVVARATQRAANR